jgi:ferredoxin
MRVRVDREACTGVQNCVVIAPEYFEMDSEGVARVLKANVPEEDEDLLLDAAENCPVDAIILEDDDGEQIYP